MCEVLKELYRKVFNESFAFEWEHRVRMQKMVYILENLGVHVGNYSFSWDSRGPYSFALDDDAYRCSHTPENDDVQFSDWANERIQTIQEIVSEHSDYNETEWLECVASLHYLKYVLRFSNCNEDVIQELMRRKNHLEKLQTNRLAMKWANDIETRLWEIAS